MWLQGSLTQNQKHDIVGRSHLKTLIGAMPHYGKPFPAQHPGCAECMMGEKWSDSTAVVKAVGN